MRVLAVLNGLGTGGAERSTAESIAPLRARGIDLEIACLHERDQGVQDQVAADTEVHQLAGASWAQKTASLRRLVKATNPDVVHTAIFEADVAGRLAAYRTHTPVLTSIVNTSYARERLADPRIRRSRFEAVRLIDGGTGRLLTNHYHALTHVVAESAQRRLRVDPGRITVVPRGRDRARLGEHSPARRNAVRGRLGIPAATPVVLSVGRCEFQKGQADLVAAVARLRRRHGDARLLVAGRPGNASADVAAAISDHGADDAVTLLGHVDNVPDLLVAADVFAFPSRFEGLGGALIEAMALGCPIVTSDLPVTREVAGCAARYVDPGDADALADALGSVLADANERDRLARAGSGRFAQSFELGAVMDRMAELYHEVAAHAGRRLARSGAGVPT